MKRRTALFAGLGLVLVGLLAGVLGMLLFSDVAQPAPQFVRRVELSSPPASGSAAAAVLDTAGGARPSGAPERLSERFQQVAGAVRSSVVYIQVQSGRQALPDDGFHDFGGPDAPGLFGPRQSVGSGVIISPDGYIVTNNHVVDGAQTIEVNLADRRRFEAEVVGTDPSTDLAVIKAKGTADLPALPMGNSDHVEVGEWVLAVGNPFRLTSTVTAGIVSALGRQVGIIEDSFGIENFIQTDAAINPGNSGGALVNMRGELVGIATAIASEGGSYEGYGFAVPSNLVARVTRDLVERGEVERALLGVRIGAVTPSRARQLGLEEVAGAYVSDVTRGGAAEAAGIQAGDVVQSVAGRRVGAPNELQSAVARQRPGDTVQVRVWRDGDALAMPVELMGRDAPAYRDLTSALRGRRGSRRPPQPRGGDGRSGDGRSGGERDGDERGSGEENGDGAQGSDAAPPVFELEGWGLGLRALTARERDAFERPQGGAFVAFAAGDGTAAQAGLPRGTVVTAVDGAAVSSAAEAMAALREATAQRAPVLVRVKRRDGTSAFYEIDPPQ